MYPLPLFFSDPELSPWDVSSYISRGLKSDWTLGLVPFLESHHQAAEHANGQEEEHVEHDTREDTAHKHVGEPQQRSAVLLSCTQAKWPAHRIVS